MTSARSDAWRAWRSLRGGLTSAMHRPPLRPVARPSARVQAIERVPDGQATMVHSGRALNVTSGADAQSRYLVATQEQELDLTGAVVEHAATSERHRSCG